MDKILKKENRKTFPIALGLFAAFLIWTTALHLVDVQPIGPHSSAVGFAGLNRFFHALTGVHMTLYTLTDWLGLIPVATGFGFALYGLTQWLQRKQLRRVDADILWLGGFYVAVAAAYLLFEIIPVNYRPVLIDGHLEVSYPSSTTLMTACVMPTAILQLRRRIKSRLLRRFICCTIAAFTAFMIVGRFLSGVHWFSDIVGGLLLSAAMVTTYAAVAENGNTNEQHTGT